MRNIWNCYRLVTTAVFTIFFRICAAGISTVNAADSSAVTKPNILLLLPDQWRFDWDGRNESHLELNLPHFTRLATEGTRFLHAYSPSPLCAPSRACLASGREYDQADVPTNTDNDYNISITTFYKLLRDVGGYHTMTVGKDDLTKATHLGTKIGLNGTTGLYHQDQLGFSEGRRSGGKYDVVLRKDPHEMYGHWLSQQSTKLSNGTTINGWDAHRLCILHFVNCTREMFLDKWYEDTWIAQQAIDLLQKRKTTTAAHKDKPWFLQVNFAGPHPPFLVTAKQRQVVEQRSFPAAVDNARKQSPETCQHVDQPQSSSIDRCDYAAELEHLDQLVGQILEHIDDNNTVVCFTSDHGEMLGDHGLVGKTYPWQGSVSVPLVCSGPGIQQGVTLEKPFVSTMDLAATFLDYAGIVVADNPGMTSQSLRAILETGGHTLQQYRTYVSSGIQNYKFHPPSLDHNLPTNHYSWRMVVESKTGLKYICCVGRRCEQHYNPNETDGVYEFLFDTINDPFDMNPLTTLPQEMKRLRSLLPKDFPCHPLPKVEENGSVFLQS